MANINIPKIGPVKKPVVIAIGTAAVAVVGWRYWQSRTGSGANVTATSDYVDPGTLPSVDGAVSSDNSYGSGTPVDNSTASYGFSGTTNDQWTQYVTVQLEQSADWSYTDIVTALGNFLSNKPLSVSQQDIVQAAIALAGYPPVGSHTVITVGEMPLKVAPSGVSTKPVSTTSIKVSWSPLAGASDYEVFNGSAIAYTGSGTSATITGLTAGQRYTFSVAGRNMVGAVGPKSNAVTSMTMFPPPVSGPPSGPPWHSPVKPSAKTTTAILR